MGVEVRKFYKQFWLVFLTAILGARIAMLKSFRSAKFKTFQDLMAPLDSTCITVWPRKALPFFLPPDSCLICRKGKHSHIVGTDTNSYAKVSLTYQGRKLQNEVLDIKHELNDK